MTEDPNEDVSLARLSLHSEINLTPAEHDWIVLVDWWVYTWVRL